MKNVIMILALLTLLSCGGGSGITDDVQWSIIKEEPNRAMSKSNIEVLLKKKIDKNELREIAQEIRHDRMEFDKLWIFYYIQNNNDKGIAWATTHFTPELEIEILGSTENQDSSILKAVKVDGSIISKWKSEKSLMGGTLILYKNTKGKLMMKTTFTDGSFSDQEISETILDGQARYTDDNTHGEYFIVESNGNLGMYGRDGKYDEAVKF